MDIKLLQYLKFKKGLNRIRFMNSFNLTSGEIKRYQKDFNHEAKTISIFMPKPRKYAGGITDILRLGTYMEEFGNKVKYVVFDNDKIDDCCEIASGMVNNFKGEFTTISEFEKTEVGIATNWQSAYLMKKHIDNIDYPVYFVQDFEPFFEPVGDIFFLAQKTYEFGFHMITLGSWVKLIIDKELPGRLVDSIDFPYEPKQYVSKRKQFDLKEEINICAYLKMDPRRSPFVAIKQLEYAQKQFKNINVNLNVSIFGLQKYLRVKGMKSLGKLDHKQLINLYSESDLGLVPSFTNFSLVPYEMISQGLPVIDFKYGTSGFFLGDGVFQIDVNIDSLFDILNKIREDTSLIDNTLEIGKKRIIECTWKKFSVNFAKLIGAKYGE